MKELWKRQRLPDGGISGEQLAGVLFYVEGG